MANRIDRANKEIQKCLIDIIQFKMNDPRLDKIVSITFATSLFSSLTIFKESITLSPIISSPRLILAIPFSA